MTNGVPGSVEWGWSASLKNFLAREEMFRPLLHASSRQKNRRPSGHPVVSLISSGTLRIEILILSDRTQKVKSV